MRVIVESSLPTSVWGILGLNSMTVKTESVASTNKGYLNVYLALGNSESMNIANTDADIQKFIDLLYDDLGGIHGLAEGVYLPAMARAKRHRETDPIINSQETTASCSGRIVVRQSATELLDLLVEQEAVAQFSAAVMSFDYRVTMRQEITNDLDETKTALASMSGVSEYTNIHRSMAEIRHAIGQGGDGSVDNPAKILILGTDGVQNKWETEHGTINTDDCTTIKESAGIQVVVLYLIYPDLEHDYPGLGANQKVIPYTQDRFEQLEACATPSMYFEANKGQSITEAFREIAEAIVERTPRLMR